LSIFVLSLFDVQLFAFHLDKRIYNVTPSADTKRAVEAAVNGSDLSRAIE